MNRILFLLSLVVIAVDGVLLWQLNKRIKSWGDHLDEPVSDQDTDYIAKRLKPLQITMILAIALVVISFLVDDLPRLLQ